MNDIRFDAGIGHCLVTCPDNGVWIYKGMGAHSLEVLLKISPEFTEKAGRLLHIRGDLYAAQDSAPRAILGTATQEIPFTPGNGIDQARLRYLLTSPQLHALEESRSGDLRLELEVHAVLPQTVGYPGASMATLYPTVAQSRWATQIEGLGRSVAYEMSVPFPRDDEPRAEAARWLRDAQRRLSNGDVDGAMLEARRTLEWIEGNAGWNNAAPKKLKDNVCRTNGGRGSAKDLKTRRAGPSTRTRSPRRSATQPRKPRP